MQALTEVNNTLQTLPTGHSSHQQLPEINTKDPTYTHISSLSAEDSLTLQLQSRTLSHTYIGNAGKCSFQLFLSKILKPENIKIAFSQLLDKVSTNPSVGL